MCVLCLHSNYYSCKTCTSLFLSIIVSLLVTFAAVRHAMARLCFRQTTITYFLCAQTNLGSFPRSHPSLTRGLGLGGYGRGTILISPHQVLLAGIAQPLCHWPPCHCLYPGQGEDSTEAIAPALCHYFSIPVR